MDEATQQNAALVEEASAAAESMQEQAQALTQAVTLFKLSDDNRMTASPVKRSNRSTTVSKLTSREPAAKKEVIDATVTSVQPRKVAAGGNHWEEFTNQ